MMARLSTPRRKKGNDIAPLRRVVTRLTGLDAIDPPMVEAADFDTLIDLIAREVDETVLPREIAVEGVAGVIAVLTISNRRLVGLEAEEPTAGDPEAEAPAERFIRRLRALCDGAGPFRLVLRGRADGFAVEEASASAAELRRLAAPAVDGQGMAGLLASLPGRAEGWLFRAATGDEPQLAGTDAACALLVAFDREITAMDLARGGPVRAPAGPPCCAILALDEDRRMLLAEDSEALLLAVTDAVESAQLIDAWKTAFRR